MRREIVTGARQDPSPLVTRNCSPELTAQARIRRITATRITSLHTIKVVMGLKPYVFALNNQGKAISSPTRLRKEEHRGNTLRVTHIAQITPLTVVLAPYRGSALPGILG